MANTERQSFMKKPNPGERHGHDKTIERIVRIDNLGVEAGWKLIDWCAENGGDEFSFQMMRLREEVPALLHRIKTSLEPFYQGTREHEHLMVISGQKKRRAISTWRLVQETIKILRREVPEGFFDEPAFRKAGWLEDFTIFRRGEIMLGVVSHEGSAVLRLASKEHDEIPGLKPPSDRKH
jgi:hypothetical protein